MRHIPDQKFCHDADHCYRVFTIRTDPIAQFISVAWCTDRRKSVCVFFFYSSPEDLLINLLYRDYNVHQYAQITPRQESAVVLLRLTHYRNVSRRFMTRLAVSSELQQRCAGHTFRSLALPAMLQLGCALWSRWSAPLARTQPPQGGHGEERGSLLRRSGITFRNDKKRSEGCM